MQSSTRILNHKLVAAGYGTLEEVRAMGSRDFMDALTYVKFCSDYESAYMELNRTSS